jgi:CubicO group peptidase (beta-lactamase class C family)
MKLLPSLALAMALAYSVAAQGLPRQSAASPTASPSLEPQVDRIFAKWSSTTPGCAVGVATAGTPALAKGYGMADLEHDVPITPETIFEAGSVSKQFTAAAVLLLAREGKLSLDDPARKYIPELPEYNGPLTIRHMINHTSGLRDWGSVASIAGWPRTTRVHTMSHVLDIVSHQRALNFPSGTQWSYSNTGFNLAAIIVQRVSGLAFPEFTKQRLFQPLGMTHTSWRDDYTRIVKGRAIAYSIGPAGFRTNMPFENVYGNGGLLTTVGDLLKWNENFTAHQVGDAAFAVEQQTSGTFNDGRPHGYGLGLYIGKYRGVNEAHHSGTTAGYSAFLTRFPDQRLSVAVLCNVSTSATQLAHGVADLYLGDRVRPATATPSVVGAEAAGLYRSTTSGLALSIASEKEGWRGNRTWTFESGESARATNEFGTIEQYVRVAPAKPTAHDLAAYEGAYASVEAEAEMTAVVEGGILVLKQRPGIIVTLTPTYADAFSATSLGTIIFRRDGAGRVNGFSVVQDRVWNMPFIRR